jgi:hypothetical protein
MRLGFLFAIVTCGACGQPAPPPLTGSATSEAPATPEPTVRWDKREIAIQGLPAIASDGSAIVVTYRDSDGGRGNPNLTLIEKDRSDREVSQLVVLLATEADTLAPAEIAARFDKATAWLHDRHTAKHLVAMTALAVGKPIDERSDVAGGGAPDGSAGGAGGLPRGIDGTPAPAVGAGVTLRWAPNQLAIQRDGDVLVQRTTPASWLAPDHPMCRGCSEICHNEAFLGGAYIDLARKAAVVIVAYRGTDTCWEPGSQAHVVAW